MGIGPVPNVKTTTLHGERIAIDVRHPREIVVATIDNAVTIEVETEEVVADNAETTEVETEEAADNAETTEVETEEVVDNAVTIEVETDAEAAEDTEVVEIAVTTEVETDAEGGLEEIAKAGIGMIHVISDLTQIVDHAVNTREAMTESRNVVIQEVLVDGVRKARVEAVVGEI